MSVKNLLQLVERRLDKTRYEQGQLNSQISALQSASQDMRDRILILSEQVALYEKSQELSPIAFWERQRLKAAVLGDIAQFEYEIDAMSTQIEKYQLLAKQMAMQARVLHSKCEKFQKYLKQQSITRRLKLEQQQHTEIEELFVHVPIKSPKSEIVINSSDIGIIKPSDETILSYALINKKEDKNNSLQMMAKKIITSLSKNKMPSSVSQNISIQPSEIETGITPKETLRNNCLQESILYPNKEINDSVIRPNFFVSPNSQDTNFIDLNNVNLFFSNIKDTSDNIQLSKGNEPVFLQNEVVEINDIQTTYDDTPAGEKVTAQHEFDDGFPLVNFNGGMVIPLRDNTLPAKPLLSLSNTGVIPENTPLSFGMIDGQHLDSKKLFYMETRNYHTVNIALNSHQETVFNHVQSELHHLTNNPRETVNIDSGHGKENVLLDGENPYFSDKEAYSEQLPLSQILADFGQDVTKNEKKAPVLQEMADIEDVNIIQNRSPQLDVVGEVYREAQTTPLRGATTQPQSTIQTVEHNVVSHLVLANEHEPRTLTYTFHQWKNAPSVTFELATKTELIAITQNREVQETLKENKHLLNSEHDVYFRQEQHQERGQHHQQQEHNQQEED